MKYITAIYLPPNKKGLTAKYYKNAVESSKQYHTKLDIFRHNKSKLGDDFILYVDSDLINSKDHQELISELQNSNIDFICASNLDKNNGLFYPKTQIVSNALNDLKEPILWMDFNDCCVSEKLSDQEIEFLCKQPIRVEWETLNLRGDPMHLKDHSVCTRGSQKQPQLGVYFIQDIDFINYVLSLKMPHDQVSFAHAFEPKYNIYQDSLPEEFMRFSTYGLFQSCHHNTDVSTYMYQMYRENHRLFKTKIFHKCTEGLKLAI